MTATRTAVAVLAGLGTATGLLLVTMSWRRIRISIVDSEALLRRVRSLVRWGGDRRRVVRVASTIGVGVVAGIGTWWPVGGVLAAVAVWFLPQLVGPHHVHARCLARVEAIASWTEMLRDVLSAAAGIEQAILATASVAPAAICGEIAGLAGRLESGQRLAPALRQLSQELADPTADLVICALIMASEHQARRLGDLLGSLAATAREQAAMRMRIDTGRARIRTSVRVIVATTLAFAAGVVLLNRGYLTAYDTPTGEAVLLAIGALFASGFAWLAHTTTSSPGDRILSPVTGWGLETDTTVSVGGGDRA